jgi:hypothetical protein
LIVGHPAADGFNLMAKQVTNTAAIDRLNFYVDLDRYPIHDLGGSAGKAMVRRAHETMERDTLCLLDGFLREPAVKLLAAETCRRLTSASPEPYLGALTPPA